MVIVSFLLLLISWMVYSGLLTEYRALVEQSKMEELSAFSQEFSDKLADLESIGYSLFTNAKTSPYAISRMGYAGIRATEEVQNHTVGNSLIWNLLYYTSYQGMASITSANSISTPEIFFEKKYKFNADSLERINNIFSQPNDVFPTLLSAQTLTVSEGADVTYSNRILTYVVPSNLNSSSSARFAVFLIQEQTVQDLMKAVLADYDGYLYLFDNKGELVTQIQSDSVPSSAASLLSLYREKTADQEQDSRTLELEGVTYSVIRQDLGRFSFLMAIPTQQYLKPVIQRQNFLLSFLAVIMLVGLLLSLLFSFTNYRPIQKLTDLINNRLVGDQSNIPPPGGVVNEISFISRTVARLFEQNSGLYSEVQELSPFRRRELLGNLLHDGVSTPDLLCQMEQAGILLDKPVFAVLYVLLDDYALFRSENSPQMQTVLKNCILNRTEENLQPLGHIYGIELPSNGVAAFLLNTDTHELVEQQLLPMLYRLFRSFKESFELSLSAGISHPFEQIQLADTAFRQAKTAAEYRFIRGKSSVSLYQESEMAQRNRYWYPVALEQEILEAVNLVETDQLSSVIARLTAEFQEQKLSFQETQYVCFGLVNSISRVLADMEVETDAEFVELRASFVSFHFETLSGLQNQLNHLVSLACKLINDKRSGAKNRLKEDLLDYISKNFSDSTLCLDSIAQHFGFSSSYISRYFKEQTGETLIKYLDNLRIKRAKQLLRETNLSLQELLLQVGYTDKTNFIRKFKKLENVTPIQYRTAYQSKIINILESDGD